MTTPCSSYLSSQSTYLGGFADPFSSLFGPLAWSTGFGRSLECVSLYQILNALKANGTPTSLYCKTDDNYFNTIDWNPKTSYIGGWPVKGWPAYLPPGLPGSFNQVHDGCCGGCAANSDLVRLHRFGDQNSMNHCRSPGSHQLKLNDTSGVIGDISALNSQGVHFTDQTANDHPVTAVVGDYTMCVSSNVYNVNMD